MTVIKTFEPKVIIKKKIQSILGTYPQLPILIFVNIIDLIIANAVFVVRVMKEG